MTNSCSNSGVPRTTSTYRVSSTRRTVEPYTRPAATRTPTATARAMERQERTSVIPAARRRVPRYTPAPLTSPPTPLPAGEGGERGAGAFLSPGAAPSEARGVGGEVTHRAKIALSDPSLVALARIAFTGSRKAVFALASTPT